MRLIIRDSLHPSLVQAGSRALSVARRDPKPSCCLRWYIRSWFILFRQLRHIKTFPGSDSFDCDSSLPLQKSRETSSSVLFVRTKEIKSKVFTSFCQEVSLSGRNSLLQMTTRAKWPKRGFFMNHSGKLKRQLLSSCWLSISPINLFHVKWHLTIL